MSFMSCIQTKIKDLSVFKEACKTHQITAKEASGEFRGKKIALELADDLGGSNLNKTYVVHGEEKGEYNLMIDTHANYSSITKRVGQNGGTLLRDYAVGTIRKQALKTGGMLLSNKVNQDQSVTIDIAF